MHLVALVLPVFLRTNNFPMCGTTVTARRVSALFSVKRYSTIQETQLNRENVREVEHHAKIANDWWNANGTLRALHALNEIRVPFIRDGLVARSHIDAKLTNTTKVLQQLHILEVGCGGGILTEHLARLGANVTAIDLGEEVIKVGREHLEQYSPELCKHITYKVEPVELHIKDKCDHYHAVVISEVLEHVSDKAAFLTSCVYALKPGGSIFITAPNKTLAMWFGGILMGEYILGLAPKGTHHWNKLVSPLDVQRILDSLNCQTVLINGSTYDFWSNRWRWINNTSMCYALQAIKAH